MMKPEHENNNLVMLSHNGDVKTVKYRCLCGFTIELGHCTDPRVQCPECGSWCALIGKRWRL